MLSISSYQFYTRKFCDKLCTAANKISLVGAVEKTRSCARTSLRCLSDCLYKRNKDTCYLILLKDGYKLRNHPFLHGFALIESYSKKETGEWISVYIIKDVEVNNNMVNLTPCKNILEINRLRNQFLTPHPSALASFARDVYWANFIGLPLSFPECNYRVMPFNPLPREEEDSLEEPIFFSSK